MQLIRKLIDYTQRVPARHVVMFTANSVVKANAGDYSLFKAAVQGVQQSLRRVDTHEFSIPEAQLHPRAVERWLRAHEAQATITPTMMRIIEAELHKHNNQFGHIMRVYHGRKSVLAIDSEALKHIPERMLAEELGEYVAEALKEGVNV
ncbi:hypothetical protein phiV141_3 [Vibrio phage phiV141]|uniref:Uncharacterized protein n=1 Tax=Vibrio phage phiV141 TaxID=2723905 RepID=A0A7D7ITE1_9CAUD|nr:hypothetical protein phiV141_3 [Vibrio phage phiV141]